MLVNAFRRQARTALAAVATRRTVLVPVLGAVRPSMLISLRALSTSVARRFPYEGQPLSEPSRNVFIGNVSFEAREDDVREALSAFGEIDSVRIVTNPDGSSRGFGYVVFATQEAATNAVEKGVVIFDRPVRMDYSTQRNTSNRANSARSDASIRPAAPPSRVLFVGNLPFSTDEAELREKFEPFGPLRSVRISLRPDGTGRGFAHIEYLSEEDAVSACDSFKEEPLYMLDRNVRVDYAPMRPTANNPPSHKLYFYDYRGNDEAMRLALRDFESAVQKVYFLRNQTTGELTGSGFIEFMSVERAQAAIVALHGQVTPYGALNLEFALPKPDQSRNRPQRSGGMYNRGNSSGDW